MKITPKLIARIEMSKPKIRSTKFEIDSAERLDVSSSTGLVAGQNMFKKLENLNFVIVSDFEFRASNFGS
jgi:hypothetical protein